MINDVAKKIIIVGGGTSGAVLAKNLSSKFHVTVLEQGNNRRLPSFYKIPLMIGLLFSRKNKFLDQVQIKFNNSRSIPFFESKLLGGASVINGCVHVIGSRIKWAELLHRFRLKQNDLDDSYADLYSKIGKAGAISLSEAKERFIDRIFFNALTAHGVSRGDVEWADSPAFGLICNTVGRIFRSSVMSLAPFRKCDVRVGFKVECLVVDNDSKVIGVSDGNEIFLADLVVLSAGVLGTNSLLQKNAMRLADKSYVDLGVDAGTGIKDHTNLRVNIESSVAIDSLNEINSSFLRKSVLFLKHLLGFKTLMRGTGATSTAHLDLDGDGEVDTRINLLNFSETGRMGSDGNLFSSSAPGFSISITNINPKSQGVLILDGGRFQLNPNYFSNELDLDHLRKSLDFVINLLESQSFACVVKKINQLELIKNEPDKYIFNNTFSGYHLIGGCAHLIDQDFKISRLGELYVCDASILADYTSSNIHSTVALLADMLARKLNKNWGSPAIYTEHADLSC
jgi:choline dehydrogenase-like flavoprotein